MNKILKTIEQVDSILDEVNEAFFNIPFENSAYQTEKFVIAASITPERAYRSIGLRMSSKISALQEAKYRRLDNEIDLDEIDEKIELGKLDKFDIRREQVKRDKAAAEIKYADKLINDAIMELNVLYKHFKCLPKFTRAQFEAGEQRHFTERLSRQHQLSGDQQSLINMDEDIKALLSFEAETEYVEQISDEHLELLHGQLSNILENREQEKPRALGSNGEDTDKRI